MAGLRVVLRCSSNVPGFGVSSSAPMFLGTQPTYICDLGIDENYLING